MHTNRKIPKALPVFILLFVAYSAYRIWPGSPGAPISTVSFTGETMGTNYIVKLAGKVINSKQKQDIHAALKNELQTVNQAMSTYIDTSELSKLNQNQSDKPIELSQELYEIIELAQSISEVSKGAFDVTVGPLVNAWGFGPTKSQPLDEQALEIIKQRIGYQKLKLNPADKSLTKSKADIYIDLSAIAKGYAVDRMSERLFMLGHTNHMIELGGEIRAAGTNANRVPWQLGIEKPTAQERSVHHVVPLSNLSMATSGDYRNFIVKDGKQYSHTIDPRRGRPVYHSLASVTVVHESCARADALATALNVLGAKEGFDLAKTEKIAALFIIRKPNGEFSNKSTPEFNALKSVALNP